MQKIKLSIIILITLLFSLFAGLQARDFGDGAFLKSFLFTLIIGAVFVALETVYYTAVVTWQHRKGQAEKQSFANPLDIWLVTIPMCVLMMVSYLWVGWHAVEVFFCTSVSLTGMLFANNLGRGSGKWYIQKSLPFFIGCIFAVAYAIVIGRMV